MRKETQRNRLLPKNIKDSESIKIKIQPQISVQLHKGKMSLGVRLALPIKRTRK